MKVMILSAKTKSEADKVLITLEQEKIIDEDYIWVSIDTEDDLDSLNFDDSDIIDDIHRRFFDDNVVYVGTYQEENNG